jgi:hypothetical protein
MFNVGPSDTTISVPENAQFVPFNNLTVPSFSEINPDNHDKFDIINPKLTYNALSILPVIC